MSNKLFLLPALLGALLLFTPACDQDDCKNVECSNGTCFEGICDCDAGYETDAEGVCTVESRAKFVGNYNTTETCQGSPATSTFSNTITTSGSGIDRIVISNFGDSGQNVVFQIENGTEVTLPSSTTISVGGNTYTVTGSGSISGEVLTITYSASGTAGSFTCTNVMTRI